MSCESSWVITDTNNKALDCLYTCANEDGYNVPTL